MKPRGMVSAARFGRRRGGLKIFHKIRVCPSVICCKMLKIVYNKHMRGNGYGVIFKGFFMTREEKKTVDFIFNAMAAAVCVIVGVTLALAYFDVLTK